MSSQIPTESYESRLDRRRASPLINPRHLGIGARRETDEVNTYVDSYESHLLFVAMAIVLCSNFDAAMTLHLIANGAVELNLAMATLIEIDIRYFVHAKIALTCLSVVLLVVHKNFRVFGAVRVVHLLYAALAGYVALVIYELWLFSLIG